MLKFERPVTENVRKWLGRAATDYFVITESPTEMSEHAHKVCNGDFTEGYQRSFHGSDNWNQIRAKVVKGDNSLVAPSDKFLSAFEDQIHMRSGWKTRDDVVGGLPNVPAYLAGQPMAMRRRTRVAQERTPLGIVVDLTTSAMLDEEHFAKRGAAILALVRVLSAARPVTLHLVAGVAANQTSKGYGKSDAVWCITQIDTAPLDLARAAYIMSKPGFPRGLCYSIAHAEYGFQMGWPYSKASDHKKYGREIFEGVIPGAEQVLYIPPMYAKDPMLEDPRAWLEGMIKEYGNPTEEE